MKQIFQPKMKCKDIHPKPKELTQHFIDIEKIKIANKLFSV